MTKVTLIPKQTKLVNLSFADDSIVLPVPWMIDQSCVVIPTRDHK